MAAASQGGKSIFAVTLAAKVCPSASCNGTPSTGSGAVKSRILVRSACSGIITHSPRSAGLVANQQGTPPDDARQQSAVVRPELSAGRYDTRSQWAAPVLAEPTVLHRPVGQKEYPRCP